MARYFIELAYKGTSFHGWQIQPNAVTVQSVLEDALHKALRIVIEVVGAGRTDSGVHASYFVAHFDVPSEIEDTSALANKLNRILPRDIVVFSISLVDETAHSRFSALWREYEYHLTLTKNPFLEGLSYRHWSPLNFDLMNEACQILFNHTDFTSFSKLHTDVKTNNCRIDKAIWAEHHDRWVFTIRADRFLRNMVRAIVGTLLEVGQGKLSVADFNQIILDKNRGRAGASVPGEALFLVNIGYPIELFVPIRKVVQ